MDDCGVSTYEIIGIDTYNVKLWNPSLAREIESVVSSNIANLIRRSQIKFRPTFHDIHLPKFLESDILPMIPFYCPRYFDEDTNKVWHIYRGKDKFVGDAVYGNKRKSFTKDGKIIIGWDVKFEEIKGEDDEDE